MYFYGAGCNYPETIKIVQDAIRNIFLDARIFVEHDLLAAGTCFVRKINGYCMYTGDRF